MTGLVANDPKWTLFRKRHTDGQWGARCGNDRAPSKMGIPTTMFTVLFAVAHGRLDRQWKEMIEDPHQKIGPPRQLYSGAPRRDYVALSRRK